MGNVIRAELYVARFRKALWVVGIILLLQIVLFAYLANAIVYRTLNDPVVAAMAASLQPANFGSTVVGSLPMYLGPVLIILGALIGVGDGKSGMTRTISTRLPSRWKLVVGRAGAAAVIVLILMVATFAVAYLCSLAASAALDLDTTAPSLGAIATSFAYSCLIAYTWTAFGLGLGIATRSLPLTIAVGLLWALVAEQLIHGLTRIVAALEPIGALLISGAAATLAEATGVAQGGVIAGAPSAGIWPAVAVLIGWAAVSVGIATILFRYRDVT